MSIDAQTNAHQPVKTDLPFRIETQGLGKRFNREWIFRNLTQTFESGNTYAITGPNGSGKSTLLQVLWGQMPPSAGSIQYAARQQVFDIETIFKHITVAAPYMDLIEEFTLEEQIQFHFKLKSLRSDLTGKDIIELMYLEDSRKKFIANFSSGMRQRLKLGLAFFSGSDVLFLDEPGTNLDTAAFDWYKNQLRQVPPHTITFIASNNRDEYPDNAHKINILDYK